MDRPEGVTLRGFLGEDIINSDFVQDKILTEEEKNSLEGPFTMEELWEAMGNANLSSAPGVNDISNKVLVKFWELIKWPLRDGINFMMEKGELTGTMRLAKIRLIPKGGDNKPTKANKLRPINILTSDYKLGSGALSLRIRKVIEKITSRCQKAYSSKSFIHEGLITVYETMSKAIYQNKSLAVILIDFSRAFDSVQHNYLYEVLSFFNFGDGIINMIKTCLSNRAAAIINGSGLTESFPIDSGTPQGDLPSTDYFKIAVEPLLIKIICSLIIQMPMLNFNLKHDDKDPDEATAFADDMGGLIDTDPNILKELDKILKDFGILSGLNINSSKTKVIVVGPDPNQSFLDCVNELGYEIDTSFKLLGVTFDNRLENMQSNWVEKVKKIIKIRNFWQIFNLSLPGRITVVKTFLLSQICYIGVILEPLQETIDEIETIIAQFLTYRINFPKNRVFLPVEKGGLGMFRIRDFIDGLRVGIFKKSIQNMDTWALELKNYSCSSRHYLFNLENIVYQNNPIIYKIIESYNRFSENYYKQGGNIKDCPIFDNAIFSNQQVKINDRIFSNETWTRFHQDIKGLKLSDFLGENNLMLDFNQFNLRNNVRVRFMEYFRMAGIIRAVINKFRDNLNQTFKPLLAFLEETKKGSQKYRTVMQSAEPAPNLLCSLNRYKWSQDMQEEVVVNKERDSKFYASWGHTFLPNNIREFSLKFVFNLLKLNGAISHFNEEVDPSCTFCSLAGRRPPPKETLEHFFQGCQTNIDLFSTYFIEFFQRWPIIFENSFMLRGSPDNLLEFQIFIIDIEILLVNFYLCSTVH